MTVDQRCVDMEILESTFIASAEISSGSMSGAMDIDGQYPVLPSAMSAMYSVVSWTKHFSTEGMREVTNSTVS